MAVCDSNCSFTYVNIGGHGSESDGGVWRRSKMGEMFYKGELDIPPPKLLPGSSLLAPFCFVGDEAFGAHQNLLTPYGGRNLTFKQKNYNHHQSDTRNVIERSFGILVRRFRIFNTAISASEKKVKLIIQASTALHNFLIELPQELPLENDFQTEGYEFHPHTSREIFTEFLENNVYTQRIEIDD